MDRYEIPMGFAMALAQNPKAMERFGFLSEQEKKNIVNGTHSIKSKEEMQEYVNNIAEKY